MDQQYDNVLKPDWHPTFDPNETVTAIYNDN